MIHYTIQTGHSRVSPRHEVSDETIAVLAPLLVTGTHALPGVSGYLLRVTIEDGVLMATVGREHPQAGPHGAPLVTVAVAPDEAALGQLRRLYAGRIDAVASAPACVDDIHPSASIDPEAMTWTGDLARCLAWAWVEHRRSAS